MGSSWARLGARWFQPGPNLDALGSNLGPTWTQHGTTWAQVDPVWEQLRPKLGSGWTHGGFDTRTHTQCKMPNMFVFTGILLWGFVVRNVPHRFWAHVRSMAWVDLGSSEHEPILPTQWDMLKTHVFGAISQVWAIFHRLGLCWAQLWLQRLKFRQVRPSRSMFGST